MLTSTCSPLSKTEKNPPFTKNNHATFVFLPAWLVIVERSAHGDGSGTPPLPAVPRGFFVVWNQPKPKTFVVRNNQTKQTAGWNLKKSDGFFFNKKRNLRLWQRGPFSRFHVNFQGCRSFQKKKKLPADERIWSEVVFHKDTAIWSMLIVQCT